MKVELLTNKEFKNAIQNLNIITKQTYKSPSEHPYYEIWEVNKEDLKIIESQCLITSAWSCYSNGENRGTAYDFITINGVAVIGWLENSKKNTFNCLTDYFRDCLGVINDDQIGAYSVYLAKTNGWSLSELWKKLEG